MNLFQQQEYKHIVMVMKGYKHGHDNETLLWYAYHTAQTLYHQLGGQRLIRFTSYKENFEIYTDFIRRKMPGIPERCPEFPIN